jgi:hypothetical protein
MGDLIAASTTDPLSVVRETVGLSPEHSEEEQHEGEEIITARRENGHRAPEQSPHFQRRIDKIVAQRGEAERRAEAAEWERDELRQRLEQVEREVNAPLDRALAAESRAAELEERLRAYEQHGLDGYANAPPASTEEQPPLEQVAPTEEQHSRQQHANETVPPEHQAFLAFQEHHNQKLSDVLSKRSDGNEIVARVAPIIQGMRQDVSQAISYALQNSPNSEHVMIHLMEHPDLLHQANQLSPQDAFAATLRLAGRLEAGNGHPRAVAISQAPPPIKPLSGSAKTEAKDPGQMSLPEYRAWYDRNFSRGRR